MRDCSRSVRTNKLINRAISCISDRGNGQLLNAEHLFDPSRSLCFYTSDAMSLCYLAGQTGRESRHNGESQIILGLYRICTSKHLSSLVPMFSNRAVMTSPETEPISAYIFCKHSLVIWTFEQSQMWMRLLWLKIRNSGDSLNLFGFELLSVIYQLTSRHICSLSRNIAPPAMLIAQHHGHLQLVREHPWGRRDGIEKREISRWQDGIRYIYSFPGSG